MHHRTALAVLALLVAACRENPPVAPQAKLADLVPKGAVQVLIVQDRVFGSDSAEFIVHVVGNQVPVASFQGEVTFARGAFEVLSSRIPEGASGEFRLVNSGDAANGRVRFAGFSTGEFGSTEAFRLMARVKGGLAAASLAGRLDVAGEVAGTAVRGDLLRGSEGVREAFTSRPLTP